MEENIEQDRPSSYYEGVTDTARYAMDVIQSAFGGPAAEMQPQARKAIDTLWDLYQEMEERRRGWFVQNVAPSIPRPRAADPAEVPEIGDA